MGSFSSRPKVPQVQPQYIVVQQPTTYVPSTSTQSETTAGQTAEESSAEARRQSLLSRSRGRFGTIQTSFRGLLESSNIDSQRKSLLGE